MGLVSKTVKVKWHGKTRKHYESLGYVYTKKGDEFEVRVQDLTKGSGAKVACRCDGCGKKLSWTYNDYKDISKEDGSTYCNVCSRKLFGKRIPAKSFYDWCIENNRKDILSRWDYELNNCSPKDISYSTHKEYYFKCSTHQYHSSELKDIHIFTNGHEGSIACKQCNTVAQYILDNFPGKDLYDVWDKDKNGDLDPWKINRGSNKKIWIKCQEREYHGTYESICNAFTQGGRCPYCNKNSGKVHQKDSLGQHIIDNYGENFLHNVWSKKNNVSPFDLPPSTKRRVWWKCVNGKHEDYLRTCNSSFRYEFRCPKCAEETNNSIIEEKTKTYLKQLGYCVLTEYDCTLKPVNPKTKHFMPYDNEVILSNGKHLIIEVHGEQHYKSKFYGTKFNISKDDAEDMLKQRKLYDRYKKYVAWKNGYEYLELPYTAFRGKNKDLYKQMIDNKIKEILRKVG